MKPERWKEVERIYNVAMELDPARRADFLEEACAGDESLRAEVESLLAQIDKRGSFIDVPAMERVARDLAPGPEPMRGVDEALRRRAPWWMYVLAVVFFVPAAVHYYAYLMAPEEPGTAIQPILDTTGKVAGIRLASVQLNSPAEKAGLKAGDIILNSSGFWSISNQANSGVSYWRAGHTYRIDVERLGERKTIWLTLGRGHSLNWATAHSFIVHHGLALVLILAIIVALTRPFDLTARWGALFLSTISLGAWPIMATPGAGIVLQDLPRMIQWLSVLIPWILRGLTVYAALTFVCVFPRRLFRRFWIWGLIWIPALVVMSLVVFCDLPPLYSVLKWWPAWYINLVLVLLFLSYCSIAVVIVLNYRRLTDVNERRRVRVVLAGLAIAGIGILPAATMTFLGSISPGLTQFYTGLPIALRFPLTWLALAFPISIAYAILRHRLFDIRVMIRLGVKYTAARGMLLSLVPIVGIVFIADLFYHRSQPLADIMSGRVWLYALLAGGAFLLHYRRRVWLDALDRRFFRERYNAQRVLHAVVDQVREAHDFAKVAPRVVEQIEAALHPEFAALLMRQPGEDKYRVLASSKKAPPPIAADSKIIGMMRLLNKPLEVSQSQTGWLRQLPQQEIRFLQKARLEWLFPICFGEGQAEALLAIGPKRSEEPYSWEDQELLQGITGSLALLLEQTSSKGFELCPECGTCYDTGSGKCRKEGADLTPLPFPRMLAHRYRFERRLGEGGMGMVYESLDTQLGRHVAVKLIRPDLTSSPEAVARFRREAKTAASFTHPNVITVHDFGVAEDQRAYLVMELLQGSTLRQELNRHRRLPVSRAAAILDGVCTAVAAAHQQRLLHRDLKPENIFLANSEGNEIAKILDFGVAKPIAPADTTSSAGQTGPGILLGTLKYMSPEELRGGAPSESWDLWALAVVAFEMLAGVHPFDGPSSLDVSNRILAGHAAPLSTHLPGAPAGWQRFFDRALSDNVEPRPASALQLYAEFRSAVN
jgi:hypothetical protein